MVASEGTCNTSCIETSKPYEETNRIEPMPFENINFPSANRIGQRSGTRSENADWQPAIEQEEPESHSHWPMIDKVLERRAVATPANSSETSEVAGGEAVEEGVGLTGGEAVLEADEEVCEVYEVLDLYLRC